jgi:pimeloyl-ACP methyl ester carboxylesterase
MHRSPIESEAAAGRVAAESRDSGLFVHRVGRGEPLVLLHGLGESHVGWHPVIETLAAHHEVIAMDLPGFGRSPSLPANRTPWGHRLAAAVQERLDDLGVDRYHVAGYSLGARVAFRLARSPRVGAVVAIGPDGTGTPMERLQGYFHLMAARGVAIGLAPASPVLSRAAVGRSVFFSGNRAMPWRLSPGDAQQLLTGFATAPGFEPTNWAGTFEVDTGLHRITQPVLILQGTADPLTTQVIRYLPFLPQAELRWVPGSHHVAPSDAPATVSAEILRFLGRHPLGPASVDGSGTRSANGLAGSWLLSEPTPRTTTGSPTGDLCSTGR